MDNKKDVRRRNIRNTYRRTQGHSKLKEEDTNKRDTLIFQGCVSGIMVLIAIAIVTIDTNFTNSLQDRLKSAISTQISVEAVMDMGEAGMNSAEKIGKEAEGLLSRMGIKKKVDKNTESKESESNVNNTESKEAVKSIENPKIVDDAIKNQFPPEAILPES